MNHRRVPLQWLLFGCLLASGGVAATTQHPSTKADGTRYLRRSSVTTTAVAVSFPDGGFSVSIYNEDESNALLVQVVRQGVAASAAELTAPADNTWTEVQSIPAGATFVFDVRRASGLIMDRAAGSGAVTIRLID